eukprot:gene19156-25764_t
MEKSGLSNISFATVIGLGLLASMLMYYDQKLSLPDLEDETGQVTSAVARRDVRPSQQGEPPAFAVAKITPSAPMTELAQLATAEDPKPAAATTPAPVAIPVETTTKAFTTPAPTPAPTPASAFTSNATTNQAEVPTRAPTAATSSAPVPTTKAPTAPTPAPAAKPTPAPVTSNQTTEQFAETFASSAAPPSAPTPAPITTTKATTEPAPTPAPAPATTSNISSLSAQASSLLERYKELKGTTTDPAAEEPTLRDRILGEQLKATADEVAENASGSLEQSEVYRIYLDSTAAREERSKQVLAVQMGEEPTALKKVQAGGEKSEPVVAAKAAESAEVAKSEPVVAAKAADVKTESAVAAKTEPVVASKVAEVNKMESAVVAKTEPIVASKATEMSKVEPPVVAAKAADLEAEAAVVAKAEPVLPPKMEAAEWWGMKMVEPAQGSKSDQVSAADVEAPALAKSEPVVAAKAADVKVEPPVVAKTEPVVAAKAAEMSKMEAAVLAKSEPVVAAKAAGVKVQGAEVAKSEPVVAAQVAEADKMQAAVVAKTEPVVAAKAAEVKMEAREWWGMKMVESAEGANSEQVAATKATEEVKVDPSVVAPMAKSVAVPPPTTAPTAPAKVEAQKVEAVQAVQSSSAKPTVDQVVKSVEPTAAPRETTPLRLSPAASLQAQASSSQQAITKAVEAISSLPSTLMNGEKKPADLTALADLCKALADPSPELKSAAGPAAASAAALLGLNALQAAAVTRSGSSSPSRGGVSRAREALRQEGRQEGASSPPGGRTGAKGGALRVWEALLQGGRRRGASPPLGGRNLPTTLPSWEALRRGGRQEGASPPLGERTTARGGSSRAREALRQDGRQVDASPPPVERTTSRGALRRNWKTPVPDPTPGLELASPEARALFERLDLAVSNATELIYRIDDEAVEIAMLKEDIDFAKAPVVGSGRGGDGDGPRSRSPDGQRQGARSREDVAHPEAHMPPAAEESDMGYGVAESIGLRSYMEDRHAVVLEASVANMLPGQSFFMVADGHGGTSVAQYLSEKLYSCLADEVRTSGVGQLDAAVAEAALRSAYLAVDEQLPESCGTECGSTALTALVSRTDVVVANSGDSRAVISRGGQAVPLSQDHSPERKDEQERVKAAGGHISNYNGVRVMGVLAMTRAIGDKSLRRYGVIPDPDVCSVPITAQDELLVLASGGFWDKFSNQEACDIARYCLDKAKAKGAKPDAASRIAAKILMTIAMERGSRDNIPVIIVDLFRSGLSGSKFQVQQEIKQEQQQEQQPLACIAVVSGFEPSISMRCGPTMMSQQSQQCPGASSGTLGQH